MTGYSDPGYAASLAEFGVPRLLPKSGGWILERRIPGTSFTDAMGCYPLFCCKDWTGLGDDIESLQGQLVSLALVTDPFADIRPEKLAETFDVCIKFKEHYVTDLTKPLTSFVRKRTLRYARSALNDLSIEHCSNPADYLSEWVKLYKFLIERHQISGIRAFSEESFRILLNNPGVDLFIARLGKIIVGAEIWLVEGEIGYGHLTAISPLGYEHNASHALHLTVMEYFSKSIHWLELGSGTGLEQNEDGLASFKRGWATETRPVYFCGKVLDKEKYSQIIKNKNIGTTSYFPVYRAGEYS